MEGYFITVVCAILSLAGVIVSALIAKITATKTAKITTEAEFRKLKLEHEYSDKLRKEELSQERDRELLSTIQAMLTALSEFREKPNRNTKADAMAAISRLWAMAEGNMKVIARRILEIIQASDPFEGPVSGELDLLLKQVVSER